MSTDTDKEFIQIIDQNLSPTIDDLPNGFLFKTLGMEYLDEIYNLINNHYTIDKNNIYRHIYSKKYLYWYLRRIPPGFIVGLIYKNKLVGMIAANLIDMIVYNKAIKVPYINFLCCQTKIRNSSLGMLLMNEIKKRLISIKMTYAFFISPNKVANSFCSVSEYVIPINCKKLKSIGFLVEDIVPIISTGHNPLHLMNNSDIDGVTTKLNKHLENQSIKPYFTNESVYHFLIPKKNIVYSFVKRGPNNSVTDFICVYKKYLYCFEKNCTVSVANLSFYFHETMTLTELVTYLLDKLPSYHIDQLVFSNTHDNMNINITKFSTYDNFYYYFYNVLLKETDSSKISFYPF
jgi:hypothetical protein